MCCIVCSEWELGKLTNKEALRALGELERDPNQKDREHFLDVSEKIAREENSSSDPSELQSDIYEEFYGD